MRVGSTWDEFTGPPPVMTYTGSKARKVQMASSRTIVAMTPRSAGMVMYQNFCSGVVPSMSAASYTSSGIAWSPASSITMKNGKARQMFMAVTDTSDVAGLPSQLMVALGSSRPMLVRKPFTTPKGESIRTQIIPATVGARSQGMISSPRRKFRICALILVWSKSASPIPMTRCITTLPTVKRMVCQRTCQKRGNESRVA